MAIDMSYADIRVHQFGQQVGQAEYDSRWGGGRVIDKFIDVEKNDRDAAFSKLEAALIKLLHVDCA